MAQQGDVEGGMAGRIGRQRPGWGGGGRPPRRRRARPGRRCDPQQKGGDAGLLGRQREAAARRQVEGLRIAPRFDDDGTERRAAQGLRARPQHAGGIGPRHHDEPARVEAEGGKTRCVKRPGLHGREALTHPDHAPVIRRGPCRKGGGKAGSGAGIRLLACEDLVHRGPEKAAAQKPVHGRGPAREAPGRTGSCRFDRGNAPPQRLQCVLHRAHDSCSCFVL